MIGLRVGRRNRPTSKSQAWDLEHVSWVMGVFTAAVLQTSSSNMLLLSHFSHF